MSMQFSLRASDSTITDASSDFSSKLSDFFSDSTSIDEICYYGESWTKTTNVNNHLAEE